MDERNEQFLKDVAWSEVWFPWKKNRIVVRGSDGAFWEKFAVIVSAIALLISAISTIATWRQVDIMQEQLVASDRNKAFQNLMDKFLTVCNAVGRVKIPYYLQEPITFQSAKIYSTEDVKIAYDKRSEVMASDEAARDLSNGMKTFGLWLDENQMDQAWELGERFDLFFRYKGEFESIEFSDELLRWGFLHATNLYLCSDGPKAMLRWFRAKQPPFGELSISILSPDEIGKLKPPVKGPFH